MPSVEADMWVRVKDGDFGEQACDPLQEAVPSPPAPLAAAANLTQPETEYSLPERSKAPLVTGNGVVLEVSSHHRLQPFRRLRQRIMPPAPQLGMDLLQLPGHRLVDGEADYLEPARRPVCPPDVGETEKVEVSGLPSPRAFLRSAAKRPNSIRRVFSGWSCNPNLAMRSCSSRSTRIASLGVGTPGQHHRRLASS